MGNGASAVMELGVRFVRDRWPGTETENIPKGREGEEVIGAW